MAELFQLLSDKPSQPAAPDIGPQPLGPAPGERDLGSLLREDPNEKLTHAVRIGSEQNPELTARVLKIEQRSGLPRKYIEENLDEMERATALKSFDPANFRAKSPKFAEWLAKDPARTALAKQDMALMSGLEQTFRAAQAGWERANPEYLALKYKELEGKTLTPAEAARRDALKTRQGALGKAEEGYSAVPWAIAQAGYAARQMLGGLYSMAQGAGWGGSAGAAMGSVIPGVGTAAGGAAGLTSGALMGSALHSYRMEAAGAFDEFSAMKDLSGAPMDPETARTAARAVGSINSIIETGSTVALGWVAGQLFPGLKKLADDLGPAAAKRFITDRTRELLANPTRRQVVLNALGKVGAGASIEGLEEFVQNLMQAGGREIAQAQSGQEFAPDSFAKDIQESAKQATSAAVGSFLLMLPFGGVSVSRQISRVNQAQQTQAFFQALGDTVSESDMAKKLPEAMRSAVAEIKKGGDIENVYVPVAAWDALFQADARAVATEVLGDDRQYAEASTVTGGELVIPVERYAEKLAGTEFHGQLMPDLRLRMGDLTAREAEQISAQADVLLEAGAEEAKAKFDAESATVQISKEVHSMVRGFMGESEATRIATVEALRYQARGARLGVDPMELWKQEGPVIKREFYQPATEAAQAQVTARTEFLKGNRLTKTGQAWRKDGDELMLYHGTSRDITQFVGRQAGAVFLTPDPGYAESFAILSAEKMGRYAESGQAIYPLIARAEKPFDFERAADVKALAAWLKKNATDESVKTQTAAKALEGYYQSVQSLIDAVPTGAWGAIEHPEVLRFLHENGYDAFWNMEEGYKNIGIFDARNIKSATGNRGTFDREDPNILYQSGETRYRQLATVAKIEKFLKPEERKKLRVDTAQRLMNLLSKLPSAQEMASVALAGKAKRGWYQHSAEALVNVFGADAPRFAALLAAMSPQTSVETNLLNALNTWKNWVAAGRPTERGAILQVMGQSVQGDKGVDSVLDAWRNNSIRALTSDDPGVLVLSGPKVNSFFRNLVGVTDEVTNDAWMANYAAVDQAIFGGSLNVAGTDPGKGPGYLAMSVQVRRAADALTKLTGEPWTPAEVQETVWSWAKATYELAASAEETRSATELVKAGAITDNLINATPDFRTLFHGPTYQKILEEAGYAEQLAALELPAWRHGEAGVQAATAEGQAAAVAPNARHLVAAAKRLDALREERALASAQEGNQTLYQADAWYYSPLAKAVDESKTAAASAQQWLAQIRKTPGVKPAEIAWTGLEDWLALQPGKVTREQISAYLQANGVKVTETVLGGISKNEKEMLEAYDDAIRRGVVLSAQDAAEYNRLTEAESLTQTTAPTKFEQWQRPGEKAGYRELLLTLPVQGGQSRIEKSGDKFVLYDASGKLRGEYESLAKARFAQGNVDVDTPPAAFTAGHFDQPNVLAHVRFNERTDAEGKRVLFLEEIQSDWAQKGKKEGFGGDTTPKPEPVADIPSYWTVRERHLPAKKLGERYFEEQSRVVRILKERGLAGTTEKAEAWLGADGLAQYKADSALIREFFSQTGGSVDRPLSGDLDAAFSRLLTVYRQHVPDAFAGLTLRAKKEWGVYSESGSLQARGATEAAARARAVAVLNESALSAWEAKRRSTVPSAPFVGKTEAWVALAVKRMIRYAAENGYDRVAWTTGEQQAARYDLSKRVDSIAWKPYANNTIQVDIHLPGQNPLQLAVDSAGKVEKARGPGFAQVEGKDLDEVVGKDVAKKILEDKQGELSGEGLRIGGEGMKAFYDKIVPNVVNDVLKKLGGGRVGAVDVGIKRLPESEIGKDYIQGLSPEPSIPETQPGFDITPAMRESVMQGLPLFASTGSTIRGQFEPAGPGVRPLITIFQSANPSTALHELSHSWLEELRRDASRADAPQQLKDDWAYIQKWAGIGELAEGQPIPRASHEMFARGTEAYVREGNAPSFELRQVFARFKDWLVRIYKSVRDLGVEITPEFRAVLDRMLATDEQIEEARNIAGIEAGAIPIEAMTAAEAAAYQKLKTEAKLEAEETVRRQAMNELVRERTDWWRAEKAQVSAEVSAEVNARPEYRAAAWLRTGRFPDGSTLEGVEHRRLDRDALLQAYSPAMLQRLAFLWQAEGGLHPDVVAPLFGFTTGGEMIDAITKAPTRTRAIAEEVDRRMLERHGDMLNDGSLAERAAEAVNSDKQAEVLLAELRILNRLGAKGKLVPAKVLKDLAVQMVAKKTVGELKPSYYERTAGRAAYEAERAMLGEEYDLAFDAKLRQLTNIYMFREATKQKQAVDKAIRGWKVMDRSDERLAKSRDVNLVNAARALLGNHGLKDKRGEAREYLDKVAAYDPEGYKAIMDMLAPMVLPAKPYPQLTVTEFAMLQESVDAIWALSRISNQITVEGRKENISQALENLTNQIVSTYEKRKRPGVDFAASEKDEFMLKYVLPFKAGITRVEQLVKLLDGGDFNGPFRRYFITNVMNATNKYRDERTRVQAEFIKLLEPMKGRMTEDQIDANPYGIPYIFKGRAELLGAMLHMGNESNLEKLLLGGRDPNMPWGQILEDGTLDRSKWDAFMRAMYATKIDKTDMDFLQGVWDLLESVKPAAQQAHKQVYGRYFDEITAKSFETPWGTYRGGYFPAVTDAFLETRIEERKAAEEFLGEAGTFMFPSVGHGFTKSRTKFHGPLQFELGYANVHLDSVMRFTHIGPTIREAGRIATRPEFRSLMERYVDPALVQSTFLPYLTAAATQVTERQTDNPWLRGMDWTARVLRKGASGNIMVFHLVNSMQQFTGLSSAMHAFEKQGLKYLRHGFMAYVTHPHDVSEMIRGKSAFMRNNDTSYVYEMRSRMDKLLANPTKFETVKEFADKHGYFFTTGAQNMVNNIVWTAKYSEAIEKGAEESNAVLQADAAVRMTQGSFHPETLSAIERGTATQRLFTMFTNYFITNLQAIITEWSLANRMASASQRNWRKAYIWFFGVLLTSAIADVITQSMTGDLWEDDDDDGYLDTFLQMFFLGQLKFLIAGVPVIGQVPAMVFNRLNNKNYDDKLNTSPAFSQIEAAGRAPFEVYNLFDEDKDQSWKSAAKDTLTLLGLVTGLPFGALGRPLGYIADVAQGRTEPEGPVEFTRGLMTGRTAQ